MIYLAKGLSKASVSNMLKKLPKMLLEYSQNFYLLCSSIMLVLCSNMNNIDVRILLLECSIRVFTIRAYVFYSIYEYKCILNVLLECIELFNTVLIYFIWADCSIREHRSDFSPLCWHNVPTYYALNYAGIFDGGLA